MRVVLMGKRNHGKVTHKEVKLRQIKLKFSPVSRMHVIFEDQTEVMTLM